MEKLVYLLFEDAETDGASLRERWLGVGERLAALGAGNVVVNVNDDDVAAGSGVTLGQITPPMRGAISFWMVNSDDRAELESVLRDAARGVAGYLVVESVPTVNTEHPPVAGQRMEGVNMVTCINRLQAISRDEFFRIWYQDHKLVAQQTQSTFGYVRNTVVRGLTENAPEFDGIVEEYFPIGALTDQKIWYAAASEDELADHLQKMMESVQRFLDLSAIESHPMSRYEMSRYEM